MRSSSGVAAAFAAAQDAAAPALAAKMANCALKNEI
jgi:hypothetical protein